MLSPADQTIQDIHYPRLSQQDFSLHSFANPVSGSEDIDGTVYNKLVFTTSVAGEKAGDFSLGPASLTCSILLPSAKNDAAAFFGEVEPQSITLKSNVISLKILSFPRQGKPVDFHGAVGIFSLTVSVQPRAVRPGDPVTLRSTIKGSGNFFKISCPRLNPDGSFKSYYNRVEQGEGKLVCEEVVIPLTSALNQLPPVSFSFFDPAVASYRTLRQGPFPLKINYAASGPIDKVAKASVDSQRVGQNNSPVQLSSSLKRNDFLRYGTYLIMTLLLLSGIVIVFYRWRGGKNESVGKADTLYLTADKMPAMFAEIQNALEAGDSPRFYDLMFRMIQDLLGMKYQVNARSVTEEILHATIPSDGIDSETIKTLNYLFVECNMVRYAFAAADWENMEKSFAALCKIAGTLGVVDVGAEYPGNICNKK